MSGQKSSLSGPIPVAATILIIAGGLISAINSFAPFDHGSWLAAYLVLVGGVAQGALAYGRVAIGAKPLSRAANLRLLVLWNFGSLVVPLGVLAEIGLAIGLGSVALLAALGIYSRGVGVTGATAAASGTVRLSHLGPVLYLVFVIALAISVLIGLLLADAPVLGRI